MDRCSQIAYTAAECIVSGVYIKSLVSLLNLKSNVKQRRVMTDLIYVNVVAICLDVLAVVLVFLNQTGISHPVQAFSYTLKLKLEFIVLNQLMAVAARGIRRESFAERRYHHDESAPWGSKDESRDSSKTSRWGLESHSKAPDNESVRELVLPSQTLSKAQAACTDTESQDSHQDSHSKKGAMKAVFKKRGAKMSDGNEGDEDEEIGVHMWEKRGKLVMEVPWFKVEGKA